MYLIGQAEKAIRDWAAIILAPLWVQLFLDWSGQAYPIMGGVREYFAGGAGAMLAGMVMTLFPMRVLESWMIEARFRPVANIGLFVLLCSTLLLATLVRPVAGLFWFCFWVGSLAWLVGKERESKQVAEMELVEQLQLVEGGEG